METNQYNDEIEIDLKELFLVVRNNILVILLAGVICAVMGGFYSGVVLKPTYTSSTMLYILNKQTTLTSLTDLQLGTQLTKDYRVLVTSRPVFERVIDNLGLNMDYEGLLGIVTISNPADTRILTISVEHYEPVMAKSIADEVAGVSAERIAEIMDMVPPNVVEEAYLPVKKTGPNIRNYTAIGGLVGCLVVGFVVVLLYLLNDSIKSSEDIEKHLGLTTLGTIPVDKQNDKKRQGKKKKRGKD